MSGLPKGFTPTAGLLTALRVHSDVAPASELRMPHMGGTTLDTDDARQLRHCFEPFTNLYSQLYAPQNIHARAV